MPIFYGIDPSVVRKQKGSYGVAFAAHEKGFKDRMEKVHQWRAALTEASNLCGLDSKDFSPEVKLVQKVFEDISLKLPKYQPSSEHYKDRLIGIEKKIREINSLSSIRSIDVHVIGIWGMGDSHVLDDVDSSIQLEDLVEGYDQLAPGSRIIVTTRNVQVLKKLTTYIYKVKGLNDTESLELFHLHAFSKNSPPIDDKMLLKKVASYAGGNPLALKVLGSFLNSKSKEEWQNALNKLKKFPDEDILNVLRISYEGLDKGLQNIFLDIACLFNGSFTRDRAESLLDEGDSWVKIGISVLIEKSLIEDGKYSIGNELWMHDLLRQMGQKIICDGHAEPGHRSRLWDAKDICHVLERNTRTVAIEVISFNMSKMTRDVKACHTAFSKMLLRRMDLRYSKLLTEIPHLSQLAPNLESINFEGCISLAHVIPYLENLDKLTYLNWNGCSKLGDFKEISRSTGGYPDLVKYGGIKNALSNICNQKLTCFKSFISSPGSHICQKFPKNLRILSLWGTPIEAVPSSIGSLSCLVRLYLDNCKQLKSLQPAFAS
nr:TMV resistance protein N-like [Ziziphus jujuba var. spinosa]